MKKIVRKIHLWLSLPFGVFITLICFSGAMLVFEKEIMEMSNPRLYYVDNVGEKALPLDVLAEKAASVLLDNIQVTGITVFPNQKRAYQVNLSKSRHASLYIDPYTGEVKGEYERNPFFAMMFKMHRWMMGSARSDDGSMGWGKLVVGVSTLMFVLALISGVAIGWPRNKKMLKNLFTVHTKKGWRRFWYDLHVVGGIYALVFQLAMALTGLTWSFQWYRNGFYAAFGVEVLQSGGHGSKQSKEGRKQTVFYRHWQKVYEQLAKRNPDFKQITISKGNASVSFNHWGNQRASDKYIFDSRSGEITSVSLYKDSPKSSKIRGWIYSVHVGSWGGILTRVLTFLAALLGATLPLTGYYLWMKKHRWL